MTAVSIEKNNSTGAEGLEVRPAGQQSDGPLSANKQFAIAITLASYCGMILVGVSHHEPWADEAQAWLLSRDLGYRYLIFHQIAYEGHPPLWFTILWIANHWFHLPYQSIGWIGGLCAIAGCWFFCRYSPFPFWVRVLFPFTYFMGFQYAIVARPYVLFPLCTFAAAHFFAEAERRPWRFVSATSALVLLSAHGVMIAAGLVAARVWYTFRLWKDVPPDTRKRLVGALVVFGMVMAFVAWVDWPPADRSTVRFNRPASEGTYGLAILPDDIATAFFGSAIPSVAFLLVMGASCACRRRFLPFVLSVALVLVFFVAVYVHLWHRGVLVMAAVAALWIAWTAPEKCAPKLAKGLNVLMLVGVTGFFAVNLYWTARTLEMDYFGPYSGSLDAANFLRSVGADARSTCGFGIHSVAIQAYFPESIFQNYPHGESFWRLERGNRIEENCYDAKWAVVPRCCSFDTAQRQFDREDETLRSYGYVPVHVSRGSVFFEGRVAMPADFVIYELSR